MSISLLYEVGNEQFSPQIQASVYFNHAALTPPTPPVIKAVQDCLQAFAHHGSEAFMQVVNDREELKRSLATFFQLDASASSSFALVPNTTSALQAIAHAIPWQSGDRILLFNGEFPTNVVPWLQAAQRHDLEICWASLSFLSASGEVDWTELDAILKQGVRLVCISAVQFQTGLRIPLEALADRCDDWGAQLCVDGIQACGAVPLALDRIHYLASGGHKWMMAVEGAGFMYLHPKVIDQLQPQTAGWLSLENPLDFLFSPSAPLDYQRSVRSEASAFEGGAQASICYAALSAAVQMLTKVHDHQGRSGIEAIYAHINQLNDQLEQGLIELGFKSLRCHDVARQSGILSFIPPEHLGGIEGIPDLTASWATQGFVCATPNACLRISPHWYNSSDQVKRALEIVKNSLP